MVVGAVLFTCPLAALFAVRAAFALWEESKVVSSHPFMFNARQVLRVVVFALSIPLFLLAAVHGTFAQAPNYTLVASGLLPAAGVDPGETATATVAVNTTTGYTGTVALTCTVTSTEFTTNLPTCLVSPSSTVPNATVSLTLTTTGNTLAGTYVVAVTGTSGTETETALPIYLNVINVPQDYTVTISKAISPTTVAPGSGAQATITVTPIGSYSGDVTLSCSSITPVVIYAPICTFAAVNGGSPTVTIANGTSANSILTISTYGTTGTPTGKLSTPRIFYAFWLAVPALALAGAGARGGTKKKWLGLFLLMVVAGSFLFLPACGTTTNTLNNPNGFVTPKNSYTFTLTGVDANGVPPSNDSTATAQASVSLSVN
jgi:hypothetical protein